MAVAAGQDVVHGAFEDELASVHDGHAVADLLDLAEQMGAKDDGLPLGAHRMDHATDRGGTNGVDASGGLVQDHEFGVVHHGLGEADTLEHPFRIGADRPAGRLGHRGEAQGVLDGRVEVGGGDTAELGAVADEFAAGKKLMEVRSLREKTRTAARGARRGRLAEDADLTGGRGDEAEHDLQRGALAAAVGPEQAEDLAARDLERKVVDGPQLEAADADAEILGEMADGDGGTHRRMANSRQVRKPAKVLISSPRMCPSRDLAIWSVKASTSPSSPSACR